MAITAFSMPGPERRNKGKGENQFGKCQEDIGDPHQQHIDGPSQVSGYRADSDAHGRRDDGDQPDHVQGQSGSKDNPAENIPSHFIGSEEMSADIG